MATAIIRSNAISGTGFSIDVAALELDSNLLVKDFIATHNGVNVTAFYTKNSSTQITYAGANVNLGTIVQIERDTVLTSAEVTFLSVTTAQDLTNALTKLRKRVEEAESYVNLVSQQLSAGGITLGVNPVNDGAYGVSWNADTLVAPSRNAVFDRLNDITSGNTPVSVPTITPTSDRSLSAASTAFVNNAIDNRVRLIATRNAVSSAITTGAWTDIPLNVELIDRDSAYNTGTFTWVVPETGMYRMDWFCQVISQGGVSPTKVSEVVGYSIAGITNYQGGVQEMDSNYAPGIGHVYAQLTSGTIIRPRCFVTTAGGSAFNMVFAADSTFFPIWVVTRVY